MSQGFFRVAGSNKSLTAAAVGEVVGSLAPCKPSVVFVFHSSQHDTQEVASSMAAAFDDALVVGCTTTGEVGPRDFSQGGVTAVGLVGARARAIWFEDASKMRFEQVEDGLREAALELGFPMNELDPARHILVTLTDGLSGTEELLLAALSQSAPDVPIVGGSAGDDMKMVATSAFVGSRANHGAALAVLLEPGVPFLPFAVHHFTAEEEIAVITRASPHRRTVQEINGRNAVDEWARLAGVDPEALRNGTIQPGGLPVQMGYRVGEELYIRAVMAVRDNELLLGGGVNEGMVLRVARSGSLLDATEQGLADVKDRLGPCSGMLLFNCYGRVQQAQAQGCGHELWSALEGVPSGGFSTYGEQYGSLHVNFTLTGVAFGN